MSIKNLSGIPFEKLNGPLYGHFFNRKWDDFLVQSIIYRSAYKGLLDKSMSDRIVKFDLIHANLWMINDKNLFIFHNFIHGYYKCSLAVTKNKENQPLLVMLLEWNDEIELYPIYYDKLIYDDFFIFYWIRSLTHPAINIHNYGCDAEALLSYYNEVVLKNQNKISFNNKIDMYRIYESYTFSILKNYPAFLDEVKWIKNPLF